MNKQDISSLKSRGYLQLSVGSDMQGDGVLYVQFFPGGMKKLVPEGKSRYLTAQELQVVAELLMVSLERRGFETYLSEPI